MVDPVTAGLGMLGDPRVGAPAVVLTASLAIWLWLRPRREPESSRSEAARPEPDQESVSRTYLGLHRGEYSVASREMYDRLSRRLQQRTGRSLEQVPWWNPSARRLGIPDPSGLRRTRGRLSSLTDWALRLETGSPFRWDFWRTAEGSRRQLIARLGPGLQSAGRQIRLLDKVP